ncbi:hypothetical protein GCM10009798_13870 [Nocardioides panacihumi]|uniref:Uncharacterized protein n=1 Tax=Nocardioides panacihumi TaxID=400774 RepID=A0ABN2QPK0_9ACTN
MDTLDNARLTLNVSADRRTLDGAWWPQSRALSEELVRLFAAWPASAGYISRVIVSPRDWDDTPVKVEIPDRRGQVKTSLLPTDTVHQLVLIMLDGQRRTLVVIPPHATEKTATKFLGAFDVRRHAAPEGSTPSLAES